MDIAELDINAVCFGILCNFPQFCGEERAKEAAELVHALYAERETLRADLARVTVEMNDLRAQWDMYGGDVVITETFKELERLKKCIEIVEKQRDAAVKKYEAEKEDFLDYALSGTQNAAPFCMNRHPDCVDKRGWCIPVKCHGFSRDKEG